MKVYVAYTLRAPSAVEVIAGVFSDEQQAIDYCDHVDPTELTHGVEDYIVDELVEPEEQLEELNEN